MNHEMQLPVNLRVSPTITDVILLRACHTLEKKTKTKLCSHSFGLPVLFPEILTTVAAAKTRTRFQTNKTVLVGQKGICKVLSAS